MVEPVPMSPRIGVAGVGWSGFTPTTAGRSYKELMFEAASAAYLDAGVDPRTNVDSFVCASEDLEEGTSIFDEYVPDQLGAVQRPVQTVASDGLFAVATAVMLIRSGAANVVAVEAHSKASDILTPARVEAFAMDPVLNRPLRVPAIASAQADSRPSDIDTAEVDDTFAYKQLQQLDALGLAELDPASINRSGGALGEGYLHEANGLARTLAAVEQLRAGDGRAAVVQSWRGVPSTSAAVAVLRMDR